MSTPRRETFDFLCQHESGNMVRVEVVIDIEALARRSVRKLLASKSGKAQLAHGDVKLSIRKILG
jgi:hypothetical protein